MGQSTALVIAALITASLAAVGSIITAIVTYKNTTRQLHLQERQLAIQEATTRQTLDNQLLTLERTHAHQIEQERLKDARMLRDAKIGRLRDQYVNVIAAAYTMSDVVVSQQVIYQGDTQGARDARLDAQWGDAACRLDAALTVLEVESEAQAVLSLVRRAHRAFRQYQEMRSMNREMPGSVHWKETREKRDAMNALVDELVITARKQLDDLEQALP
jgi:hypothetical protein